MYEQPVKETVMRTVSKTRESKQAIYYLADSNQNGWRTSFSEKKSEASISKFSYFFMILVSAGSNTFFSVSKSIVSGDRSGFDLSLI